jgi:ADP-ribosylation factor related protein 1
VSFDFQTLLEQCRHLYTGSSDPRDLKIPPTAGLNIGKVDVDRTRLILWDLGGQSGLRVLWEKYFSDAHAIIYVVDSADPTRFDENAEELEKILSDKELLNVPMLVFANKQDQVRACNKEDIRRELGIEENPSVISAFSRSLKIQPISALKGDGIEEGIRWLLKILPSSVRTKQLQERAE